MTRIYDFLKEAGTYYLATVEDGQARVRPFGTIDIFEGKLTFQTGRIKPCYRQMKDNPYVEICAMVGGDWIRVSGKVEECPVEAEVHMLEAYPHLKAMYQPGDGNSVVFAFTSGTATIASFTKEPVTIEF